MRNLPTEVLISIFRMAIDAVDFDRRLDFSTWNITRPSRTSLHLAQVCSQWRAIFALNPSLWNILEFCAMYDDKPAREAAEMHRFHRCATAGIASQQSLIIPDCTDQQLSLVYGTLGRKINPYKALEIQLLEEISEPWNIKAFCAREVTVYRADRHISIYNLGPLLRSAYKVTIYGDTLAWGMSTWTSLETLVVKDFAGADGYEDFVEFGTRAFLRLLWAAPFLKTLELDFHAKEESVAWGGDTSISHSSIHSLTVHLHHFNSRKGPFGVQLDLPALDTLRFISVTGKAFIQSHMGILGRQISPKRLVLPRLKADEVKPAAYILRLLAQVEYLEITGERSGRLLQYMDACYRASQVQPRLLPMPKLTFLHLENVDIKGNALSQFIQAKCQCKLAATEGISALEDIQMYNTLGIQAADWWAMQSILEQGRRLNVI